VKFHSGGKLSDEVIYCDASPTAPEKFMAQLQVAVDNFRHEEQRRCDEHQKQEAEWKRKQEAEILEVREKCAKKLAILDLQEYPVLTFSKGINPKTHADQWEARAGGKKYVLANEDSQTYVPSNGPMRMYIMRELVPQRVFLVKKLLVKEDA
jgi:hypothetical protein